MARDQATRRWDGRLNTIAMIVFGITLAVTPLALWVAWTLPIFVTVVAVGSAAGVLICVLARYQADAATGAEFDNFEKRRVWFSKLLAKLTAAHPMIHHHEGRHIGEFAFWRSGDAAGASAHRRVRDGTG